MPEQRIASITWLSRSEGDPALLGRAARIPVNHGSAEEVLALRPDLVLAGRYTTGATRALLERAGVPLLEVEPAGDWDGVRRTVREVAAAVQAPVRGEALLAAMDADLRRLAERGPRAPVRVIGWGGSGEDVPGRDTMFNTIVEAAGAVNVAALSAGTRSFDVEQVLRANPAVLMRGAAYAGHPALRNLAATHRALRGRDYLTITYPEAVYGCAVPRAARAAVELAAVLDQVRVQPHATAEQQR